MTIRIGLIGGGNISETHARAARAIPETEIVAIFGDNTETVGRLCLEYGAKPYSDLDQFLAHKPMDLVAIGSPSGLHAAQGRAAVRHALHVLIEKPIDVSTARVDALIVEAETAGMKLGVFFQDRLKPDILRLKHSLKNDEFGKIIVADARVKWYRPTEYYKQSRWRGTFLLDGGGALINQGIHTIDLLIYLLGDVAAVQAKMATAVHEIEAEDTLVALLEFASGAVGSFIATTSAFPGYPRRVELSCTEGTVVLEHDQIVGADLRHPISEFVIDRKTDRSLCAVSPVVSDADGHQAILEDFILSIQAGSSPACDGRQGRRSLAVVEAIYQAARTGNRTLVDNVSP